MSRQSTEDSGGGETILCAIIMINTCYYTFVQTQEQTPRYLWTWVMVMCPYRLIKCNTRPTGVRGVDSAGAGGVWDISVFSIQFCCPLKTAPKIKPIESV